MCVQVSKVNIKEIDRMDGRKERRKKKEWIEGRKREKKDRIEGRKEEILMCKLNGKHTPRIRAMN